MIPLFQITPGGIFAIVERYGNLALQMEAPIRATDIEGFEPELRDIVCAYTDRLRHFSADLHRCFEDEAKQGLAILRSGQELDANLAAKISAYTIPTTQEVTNNE